MPGDDYQERQRMDDILASITDATPDAVFLTDLQATITYCNEQAGRQFNCPAAEIICWSAFDLIAPEDRMRARENLKITLEQESIRGIQYRLCGRDGSSYDGELNATLIRDADGNPRGFVGVLRDVTERKRAAESSQRQNMVMEGINRILREALIVESEEELGRVCLAVAEELTRSKFGFIGMLNKEGRLADFAAGDPTWVAYRNKDRIGQRRTPGGLDINGIYERVFLEGKPLLTNDPAAYLDGVGLPEGHFPLAAFLSVPLIHDGRAVGLIVLANREGGYQPEDLESVETLAHAVGQVLMHKRAEKALREGEECLRLALEGAGAGMWARDQDGGWQATPQLNALFGLTADSPSIRELDFLSYAHPEDLPHLMLFWNAAIENGMPFDQEYRVIWPDGNIHWLASKGRVSSIAGATRFVGITYDITGRTRMEDELRQSEERARELIRYAPSGIYEIEFRTRKFRIVNDVVCQYLGYTREELLSMSPFDVLDDRSKRLFQERIGRLEAGEKPDNRVEYRVKAKDGREYDVLLDVTFMYRDGKPDSALVVAHDITERKRVEEALRQNEERYRVLAEELREADRRKNEFLAVLSHELRNPLAAMQNSLHILDRASPAGEEAKRAKAVIDRQFGQLTRLVEDLLDTTRITQNRVKLQRQRLELNELLRRTVVDHQPLFEEGGVGLEHEFSPSAIFVNADGTRLAQVVENLLHNAVKFTPRGGIVHVSVAGDPTGKWAVIRVADTGVGMAPEVLPRLFQPFMQADTTIDRSRGGLGLGLALCKGLVELHGGEISAHSAGVGKGSEFLVRLPIEDTQPDEPQIVMAEVPLRDRRVLIIEDNVDFAESLRELLELDGHEVAVAYSGTEGLTKAHEFQPEVLLCDIGLPGMDGYDVARAFRADDSLRGTFLIALTGYAQPEDLQRAIEAGFDRHLAKPPDLKELERMLAEVPVPITRLPRLP